MKPNPLEKLTLEELISKRNKSKNLFYTLVIIWLVLLLSIIAITIYNDKSFKLIFTLLPLMITLLPVWMGVKQLDNEILKRKN